ncbi:CLAVATA3/ESR (CLE)-related protein 45 [Raphanus sativus]|uniref:CLAVATA3/ESR (CLE)-related protein 45 n=1 Tax=Raphanus sativus TaxID=3726 RepID=A0A6J0M9Z4_RAPSA|nr:CLAVATA3/ESR (CLE)-related protein 45 [Raphanus sativus]KAJ4909653.1 CLAVATA3/ESR (CLE)-related protein 45 [Raphanus sativus]
MLGYSTRMMLCLLVCIGLLSDNRYKVSALGNRAFFLRQIQGEEAGVVEPGEIAKLRSIDIHSRDNREGQGMLSGNRRILEEVNKNKVRSEKIQQAQKDQTKDSFQSNKRRVRRGSDPIHNKSQPLS